MNIEELKGRKFKRNKYGLSIWEDTIKDVTYKLNLSVPSKTKGRDVFEYLRTQKALGKKYGYRLEICVIGEKTFSTYNINEIIVY